jgi:hypothetical protein
MITIEKFKSGHFIQSIGYKYFMPEKINSNWAWSDTKINRLFEKASFELAN